MTKRIKRRSQPSQRNQTRFSFESSITDEEIGKLVADTVRYCMFLDYQKLPIRRGDITKNITKEYKGVTPEIVKMAQERLLNVFGYELVEIWRLSHKDGRTCRKLSSGTYILKNTVPSIDKDTEDIEQAHASSTFILQLILGLLFINRSGLEKEVLDRYLNKIITNKKGGEIDVAWRNELIEKTLVKQLYLEKLKTVSSDGKETFTYYMGPRSEIEFGKVAILEFVSKMFGEAEVDPVLRKEVEDEVASEIAGTEKGGEEDDEDAPQSQPASQASQREVSSSQQSSQSQKSQRRK